jgi:hypothetical protein
VAASPQRNVLPPAGVDEQRPVACAGDLASGRSEVLIVAVRVVDGATPSKLEVYPYLHEASSLLPVEVEKMSKSTRDTAGSAAIGSGGCLGGASAL